MKNFIANIISENENHQIHISKLKDELVILVRRQEYQEASLLADRINDLEVSYYQFLNKEIEVVSK